MITLDSSIFIMILITVTEPWLWLQLWLHLWSIKHMKTRYSKHTEQIFLYEIFYVGLERSYTNMISKLSSR